MKRKQVERGDGNTLLQKVRQAAWRPLNCACTKKIGLSLRKVLSLVAFSGFEGSSTIFLLSLRVLRWRIIMV